MRPERRMPRSIFLGCRLHRAELFCFYPFWCGDVTCPWRFVTCPDDSRRIMVSTMNGRNHRNWKRNKTQYKIFKCNQQIVKNRNGLGMALASLLLSFLFATLSFNLSVMRSKTTQSARPQYLLGACLLQFTAIF